MKMFVVVLALICGFSAPVYAQNNRPPLPPNFPPGPPLPPPIPEIPPVDPAPERPRYECIARGENGKSYKGKDSNERDAQREALDKCQSKTKNCKVIDCRTRFMQASEPKWKLSL